MNKIVKEITSKYKEPLDSRVVSFLDNVTSDLDEKNINHYSRIVLDMLVPQLIIYFKAQDNIQVEGGVSHSDDYNRKSKSPEIGVLQKANDQILSLLDKLVLSPLEKAKIKRINKNDEEDAKELLDALIN